jgi:hypothetical protein
LTTVAQRIVTALSGRSGLSDRELTDVVLGPGKPQQSINAECRRLEQKGVIDRRFRGDGKIGNFLSGQPLGERNDRSPPTLSISDGLSEDAVKQHLSAWLVAAGWAIEVK